MVVSPQNTGDSLMNIRTQSAFVTLALALASVTWFSDLHAQEYEHGAELQNCVSTYYDAGFYGWLAIRNNCGAPITVSFLGATGANIGTVTLAPGAHSSTGYSRGEWAAAGGIYYAVCNAGYYPIEANRGVWTHAGQPFLCKRR
jgi:hypothetical protein